MHDTFTLFALLLCCKDDKIEKQLPEIGRNMHNIFMLDDEVVWILKTQRTVLRFCEISNYYLMPPV